MHSGKKKCLSIPQWDRSRHIHIALSTTLKYPGCLFIPSLANSHLRQLVWENSGWFSHSPSAKLSFSDQWRVNVLFFGWLKTKRDKKQKQWQDDGRNSCCWNVSVINCLYAIDFCLEEENSQVSPWTCPTLVRISEHLIFCLVWQWPQDGEERLLSPVQSHSVHETRAFQQLPFC